MILKYDENVTKSRQMVAWAVVGDADGGLGPLDRGFIRAV
jgi:hypothetical protein